MRSNYQLKEKIENNNKMNIDNIQAKEGKRRQAQDKWTEGPRPEINDLHPVEGPEKASSG